MTTNELLRKHFDELRARKDALLEKSRPLREERDKLNLKAEQLRLQIRDLSARIREAEGPEVFTLSDEIARVAKALGGAAMSDAADAE